MVTRPKPKKGKADRKRYLRWMWRALAVLVPVALICAKPAWPEGDGRIRPLPAEIGYKAAADQLAAAGLLRVRTVGRPGALPVLQVVLARERLEQNPELLGDCRTFWERQRLSPFYVERPSRDCIARLADYIDTWSYLAEDMRQSAQWELDDDRVVGLRSNARVLIPAGDPRRSWQGRIRYADEGTRGAVNAMGAGPMLTEVGTRRPLFRFRDGGPMASVRLDDLLSSRARAEGGSIAVLVSAPGSGPAMLRADMILLERLGRSVLLGIPPDLHGARIYVDGRPWTVPSSNFDNLRHVLIRPGQYLTLEDRRGRRLATQLVEAPGSISEVSGGRRIREASLYDVAQGLEWSGVRGDVAASIVATLQADLQRRLAASMETGRAPGADPRISYRGAALLMDGLTGEIAAAATYPTEPGQLAAAERNDPRRTVWLTTNVNFQPLPIGSAAKVPFAAAIVEAHPGLMRRRIPFHREFRSIAGMPLIGQSGERLVRTNERGRGMVGFRDFIADSNNEYALSLLRWGTIAEGSDSPRLTASGWAANLWRFACVIPFGLVPQGPDLGWHRIADDCSFYLWRGPNGDALGDSPALADPLRLRMGRIGNLFTDYYLDIVGANRSSWTTANLAQAYSRILSGRAISPNLVRGARAERRNGVVMRPAVWSAITDGMASVLRTGTAHSIGERWLAATSFPGVYFYAKTGTSTLSAPARGNGHVIVLMAARTRGGARPQRPSDICALKVVVINLQRNDSSALDLVGQLLNPATGQIYRRWLTQPCAAEPASPNPVGSRS